MRILGGAIALSLLVGLPAEASAPQVIEGELTTEDAKINDGTHIDRYEFQGKAGESVAIELNSEDFDAYLILNHNGQLIGKDNNGSGTRNAFMVTELPDDGTYQVLVNTANAGETGQYQLVLRTATVQDQQRSEAYALNRQGLQQYQQSQWDSAFESFQRAGELYRAAGDRLGEGTIVNNIGSVYRRQGQYLQALKQYQAAVAIRHEVGDFVGLSATLNNMGGLYRRLGKLDQALGAYQAALGINRQQGDRLNESTTLANLGGIYRIQGFYGQALEFYGDALLIRRALGDRRGIASISSNIGLVYFNQGQYKESLDQYQSALVLRREVGDRLGEGVTLSNIGGVYRSQKEFDKALEHYDAALAIHRSLGARRGEGLILGNVGGIYLSRGQFDQALEHYQTALAIFRELGDRRSEGGILSGLGEVYRNQERYDQALEHLKAALALRQELGDRAGQSKTLNSIGLLQVEQENFDDAQTRFQESIAIVETIEQDLPTTDRARVAFFETRSQTYSFLEGLLVLQKQSGAALEIADRSRARSLSYFLNPTTDNQPQPPLNIDQIRQLAINNNATLITYSIVKRYLFVWVINPQGDIAFRRVDPTLTGVPFEVISGQIRRSASDPFDFSGFFTQDRFRADMGSLRGGGTSWRGEPKDLKRAYELLIQPIEDFLPTGRGDRLIIVPYRELSTVPFVALIDSNDRFLIDRYAVTIAPSLRTLSTIQQKQTVSKGQPLIVGNPSPMPDQLSALPGSEKEAQAIAQALNTTPLIGSNANEAAVKQSLETANILHFATHGIVADSDRNIEGNWLALADDSDDSEDGKLTLTEIFNSNLNAQLAVLSACNTVSGEVTGEGVLGLARAFLKAGAPAVVASLWQVPDEQTRLLMEAFYRELLAGETYADALRIAQLEVRSQFTNPRNWAAFMVIGDGDRTLELP
ncbi:MAG: CHAT domain-containing protein [Cyanobacteria bacterium P01_D01_bin.73]